MQVPNDQVIFESKMRVNDIIEFASYLDDDKEIVITQELCDELEAQISSAVLQTIEDFIDSNFS